MLQDFPHRLDFQSLKMNAVISSSRPRTPPAEAADDLDDPPIRIVNSFPSGSDSEDELQQVRQSRDLLAFESKLFESTSSNPIYPINRRREKSPNEESPTVGKS